MANKIQFKCVKHPNNEFSISVKCCNQRVCWLCYNDTKQKICNCCDVKICNVGCKGSPVRIYYSDFIQDEVWCKNCYSKGKQSGNLTNKKPNDIDIWLHYG